MDEKGILNPGVYLFSGNDACAEGAIMAGCKLYAGYPITPSSDMAERMAFRLPQVGGAYVQMEDEMASMGVMMGASWAGVKVMTATSGLGFSEMQEHISFAVATETPCVIIDVQRGGPGSGVVALPMQGDVYQARWGHHASSELIALTPSSVQECFNCTIDAFNLSEQYRVPVILLTDAKLAHLREKMRIPPVDEIKIVNRRKPTGKPEECYPFLAQEGVAPMPSFGEGYRFVVTSTSHNEKGDAMMTADTHYKLVRRINEKILRDRDKLTRIETQYMDDADVAVVAYGTPARGALRAVKVAREAGIKAGYVRLITLWPFNEQHVRKVLEGVRQVVVVELNMGQMEREVCRAVGPNVPVHLVMDICRLCHPDDIYRKIREVA